MELVTTILIIYIFMVLSYQVSIIIHEFGHLFFGLRSGYTFIAYQYLFITVYKKENRLRISINRNNLVAGQCILKPVSIHETNFRYVAYNAGGYIFNFIFVAIGICIAFFTRGAVQLFFIVFSLFNMYSGVYNAIPSSRIIPSDGLNLKTAKQSKEAAYGLHCMMYLQSFFHENHTYQDLDISILQMVETADRSNYFVAFIDICLADYYRELQEFDKVIDILESIPYETLPKYYRILIQSELVECYIIKNIKHDEVEELYQSIQDPKNKRINSMSRFRAATAYMYVVEGEKEKALSQLDEAIKACQSIYNEGLKRIEIHNLHYLKQLLLLLEKNCPTS